MPFRAIAQRREKREQRERNCRRSAWCNIGASRRDGQVIHEKRVERGRLFDRSCKDAAALITKMVRGPTIRGGERQGGMGQGCKGKSITWQWAGGAVPSMAKGRGDCPLRPVADQLREPKQRE